MSESLFWALSTFFSSILMAFFSTQEMACISYNRLKLEVQARSGIRRARWIQALLQKPTALFGTTLVGVNLSLVTCSECARQLFSSLGMNPNYSPIFLVPYLLLSSELIPMFAARTFPEHTARLGAPFIWVFSYVVRPFASLIEKCFRALCKPWRKYEKEPHTTLFHHAELQELLRPFALSNREDENPAEHLFTTLHSFREKKVTSFMVPLSSLPHVYEKTHASYAIQCLALAKKNLAIVRTKQKKIVGIIKREDLYSLEPTDAVLSCLKTPLFIPSEIRASQALSLLIEEEELLAFVINSVGVIIGILSIDAFLEECLPHVVDDSLSTLHISKTIDADTKMSDFCLKYNMTLSCGKEDTFREVIERVLEHKPKVGEVVLLGPLEVTVLETTLLGPKTLFIRSR